MSRITYYSTTYYNRKKIILRVQLSALQLYTKTSNNLYTKLSLAYFLLCLELQNILDNNNKWIMPGFYLHFSGYPRLFQVSAEESYVLWQLEAFSSPKMSESDRFCYSGQNSWRSSGYFCVSKYQTTQILKFSQLQAVPTPLLFIPH